MEPTGDGSSATPWSVLRTTVAEGCQEPKPRGGHTATMVDKNLLIQGGQQHKRAGIFEYFSLNPVALNTETHQWFEPRTALGKGPMHRAYHTATRVGPSLFIFGGTSKASKAGGKPLLLGDMPVFDLAQMAWIERDVRGQKPRARCMHTAALSDGKLFIIGGFDGMQVRSAIFLRARLGTAPSVVHAHHACSLHA